MLQIRIQILCFSIFSFLTCVVGSQQEIIRTDPNVLATKVQELTEQSLKYEEMQSHLDTLTYQRQPLVGEALLNALSSSFSTKFQSRIAVVTHLRDAVIKSYSGTTSSAKQCCYLSSSELEHDTRFKQPASVTKVCELVSSSAAYNAVKLQNAFRDACVENLRNVPSLKWQYFGSEQGVTTTFPATKAKDCGSYDNRFRPWYVQSNVPKPKQIVIVIDKSGSMQTPDSSGVSYMELARQAANTVIETLNPYDKFAVVAFSSSTSVYSNYKIPNGGCFSNNFAQATPQNKKLVKDYVSGISASGGTAFGIALNAAFTFFDNVPNTTLDRAILFMSDGEPGDTISSILATLNRRNSALNNSVAVLTYGLGSGADGTKLQQMAQSTSVEVGSSNKAGTYIAITNPSQLRNQMASYYNFFSILGKTTDIPIWTVPYLDSWGLGLMVTANLPVYIGGRLVGVTAVDITIEELLAESSYFKPTELSYSFVINEEGLVINHPNFPYVTDREPLFVEATAFERDQEFISVFQSMKSGGSGKKSFVSTRILPAGDGKMYGVRQLKVKSTYYWKQIPGTKFSVCLVLADEDAQTVLAPQGSLASGTFLYHRFDLVPPTKQCYHVRSFCAKDKSSVALAARSFEDPELYLTQNASVSYVRTLTNYMEGKSSEAANTKRGVKDAVVATYKADELWKAAESNGLNRQVFWRYVATEEGLFRIFPGTQMPSNFDPVKRAWYENAQANRGKYVITPPYSDAASAVSVVTLTRALFEGKFGGVHNPLTDKAIGAMGTDIVTSYFQQVLSELYPTCNQTTKCILIDNAGFVITAPQFVTNPKDAFNKHIASLEPEIAHRLQTSNVLQPRKCANIENALIHETFQILPNQTRFKSSTGYPSCEYFELMPVIGTNAFLIMASKQSGSCGSTSPRSCSCSSVGSSTNTPTCSNAYSCSCPCTSYNQVYQPCTNKYLFTTYSPQPCTPEIKDLTQLGTPPVDLNTLEKCYEISFSVPITTGPGGGGMSSSVFTSPTTRPTTIGPGRGDGEPGNLGPIVGGVVGGIVVLVIIIIVLKKACQNTVNATTVTAVTTAPVVSPPPTNPNYGFNYPPASAQTIPNPYANDPKVPPYNPGPSYPTAPGAPPAYNAAMYH